MSNNFEERTHISNHYEDLCYRYSIKGTTHLREALRLLDLVSKRLELVANFHKDDAHALMHDVQNLLNLCVLINPSVETIHKKFKKAWGSFIFAEAKDLNDAFNIHRRRGWQQVAARRWIKDARNIEAAIDALHADGVTKTNAYEIVGEQFDISGRTARNLYSRYRSFMKPIRRHNKEFPLRSIEREEQREKDTARARIKRYKEINDDEALHLVEEHKLNLQALQAAKPDLFADDVDLP